MANVLRCDYSAARRLSGPVLPATLRVGHPNDARGMRRFDRLRRASVPSGQRLAQTPDLALRAPVDLRRGTIRGTKYRSTVSESEHGDHLDVHRWTR